MSPIRENLKRSPLGPTIRRMARQWRQLNFRGSGDYWEARYNSGGNSGSGSYGRLAHFKADIINALVEEIGANTVIEFGCGDGNQLSLAKYPSYIGFDVSITAIENCKQKFANRPELQFLLVSDAPGHVADITLSLDVIYHLVEDAVFDEYMELLFQASRRYVLIYASDFQDRSLDSFHIRNRKFSDWITSRKSEWRLVRHIPNEYPFDPGDPEETSFADFFLYEKI